MQVCSQLNRKKLQVYQEVLKLHQETATKKNQNDRERVVT